MRIYTALLVSTMLFASTSFAEPATEQAAENGSETTAAIIDSAEDTGKGVAGSAIDSTASAVAGQTGADIANMGKSMASEKADQGIGKAADSARAQYGVKTATTDSEAPETE